LKSSKLKNKIKEIRFREIGFALRDGVKVDKKTFLKITKYRSSGGEEYFLEIVNKQNILFGLLRLRINRDRIAIVREIHVYGKTLDVGEKSNILGQHSGFGKMLLSRAEEIVRKNGINELKIISGVGVREYYKKLGYKIDENGYMDKKLQ